jgi:hypothetical protein
MMVLMWIGIGLLVLFAILVGLFIRKETIGRRPGTIEMSLRLNTFVPERGWSPGLGRFDGDELLWFRVFSPSFKPKRRLRRHGLVVESRRAPEGEEKLALADDWVVLRCLPPREEPVEIAFSESTLTGFLSWLEAAPPGAMRRLPPPA